MNEQNTLYVDVGIPKTRTSAIQRVLANNRHQLAGFGYIYPGTGENHWPLVEGLRDKEHMLTNDMVQTMLLLKITCSTELYLLFLCKIRLSHCSYKTASL